MNLNMPQPILDLTVAKGRAAGLAFSDFSVENHYWIRWRNLASSLQRYERGVADAADLNRRIPDFSSAYALSTNPEATPPSYPFSSKAARERSVGLSVRLQTDGRAWRTGPDLIKGAPNPQPQLSIVPTY